MKHKLMVNINDDKYNKLVFISNFMGMSITDFMTQIIVTQEFTKTVDTIFDNVAKMAVSKCLNDNNKK